jgi:predicted amidophosphoribosyltransferase
VFAASVASIYTLPICRNVRRVSTMGKTLSNLAATSLNRDSVFARFGLAACLLCGGRCGDEGLCGDCRAALPWLTVERCPTCASPSPQGLSCGRCLAETPVLERVDAALAYTFPVDGLVQMLKYRHHLAAATVLGSLLVEAVRNAPVPT